MPKRLKTVSTDKLGFALKELMDYQIHLIANLNGKLDPTRFEQAMRCLFMAEPVMGSRFIPHPLRPWWEPVTNLERDDFLSLKKGGENELMEFIAEPFDFFGAPQVRACIVSSDEHDTLCLKYSHVPTDGASVKEGTYLIAEYYRRLGSDPHYMPEPNLDGSRSARQISSRFGLLDKLKMLRRYTRNSPLKKGSWKAFPVSAPASDKRTPYMLRVTVPPEKFRTMKAYGIRYGATVNDMLLTAFYRSLHNVIGAMPGREMGVMTTADLRRYLPEKKAGALCCMSAFFYSNIGEDIGVNFNDTLMKVKEDTVFQKGDFLGLGDYPALAFFMNLLPYAIGQSALKALMNFEMNDGHSKAGLTNLGIIDENLFDLGGPGINDAYILVPLSIMLKKIYITGFTTFRDKVSISSGFYGSEKDRALVESILNKMVSELPG